MNCKKFLDKVKMKVSVGFDVFQTSIAAIVVHMNQKQDKNRNRVVRATPLKTFESASKQALFVNRNFASSTGIRDPSVAHCFLPQYI